MKISIIGAGNVGSLTALRVAQEGLGDIVLVDVVRGLAKAKAFDMEDARPLLKQNYIISGADDFSAIKDSQVVVVTAGLARKPGMTREELVNKNAAILRQVCLDIKKHAADAVVIIVTNPLDLMVHLALKTLGSKPNRVFGMGIGLDAARFANLIGKELNIPVTDIEACVIGRHGEGMLPLAAYSRIKGARFDRFLDQGAVDSLVSRTIGRGAEIVSLLGNGSAYFAPSAAAVELVRAVVKDQKRILGACAYLDGEYGMNDICLGVPCRIGREGIEQIIELDLSGEEKRKLSASAEDLRKLIKQLPCFIQPAG